MERSGLPRAVRILAIVTALGMFVVLVMGATVTNTGSQTGCGPSWPLCRGRFIPQFAVATAIEFSHRAMVGVESVLIVALAIGAWYLYHYRLEVRILAPVMVFFLFLQAGLGAWAVMVPQSATVLALHFGVSLIAFASVVLTAVVVFELAGGDSVRDRPLPPLFGVMVWGTTLFTYAVVYLGAYVRHTNAEDACRGWPLCNGAVIPTFHGLVDVAFGHRMAALVLTLAIVGLVLWSARIREGRPDMLRAGKLALALVVLQALSGAVVVFTGLDLFAALLHAGLVALLFGCLTYLCLHALPRPAEARAESRDGRSHPAHVAAELQARGVR